MHKARALGAGPRPGAGPIRAQQRSAAEVSATFSLPVEIAEIPDERLPEPVEAAAYYLIAEALTNVTRYAHASTVRARVAATDGKVVVEVSDDGVGGADPTAGSGLRGLADRVEALGGSLKVISPAGAGTALRAEIPQR